jgi:hypothetical protein
MLPFIIVVYLIALLIYMLIVCIDIDYNEITKKLILVLILKSIVWPLCLIKKFINLPWS